MSNHMETLLHDLLARVAKLEAQAGNLKGSLTSSTPPPVATDKELCRVYNDAPEHNFGPAIRAVYNLGIEHGQAGSREVAEPAPAAGGLVERVSWLIADFASRSKPGDDCKPAAVKIVVEQAKWLREKGLFGAADLFKKEAGR